MVVWRRPVAIYSKPETGIEEKDKAKANKRSFG
jgi:hypothetical protein